MFELVSVIFFAFLLDLLFGDPRYRCHPIRIIGQGISLVEKALRRCGSDGKAGGIILVLVTEIATVTGYLAISGSLKQIHPLVSLGFDLFMCYSCLALQDLMRHISPVIDALNADRLDEAREKIAMVVGRDVSRLDREGISRAGVETLAENFVDGFLSPIFWFLMGGGLAHLFGFFPARFALSLMLAFKVASTLDSMVGYKRKGYAAFGWAGARLDDLMNFIPARLSLIILFFGACLTGHHPLEGLRVALRDRLKHDSPNAAHAESFVAGALRIRLGGPTRYPEGVKDRPWLGAGYPDPGPKHIHGTSLVLRGSAWITVVISLSTLLLLG